MKYLYHRLQVTVVYRNNNNTSGIFLIKTATFNICILTMDKIWNKKIMKGETNSTVIITWLRSSSFYCFGFGHLSPKWPEISLRGL